MCIAVFVSGGGTNLQALIDREARGACPYHIAAVVSNKEGVGAIARAERANIPVKVITATGTRDERRRFVSDKALALCRQYEIDLVVLAGFLTVLAGDIITEYSGRIINLHPALLPKFGGVGMWGRHVHEAVIAADEKESGCTVHLVDAGCDTGRILVQRRVPVFPGDTPETLAARIAPEEHRAIVEAVLIMAGMDPLQTL